MSEHTSPSSEHTISRSEQGIYSPEHTISRSYRTVRHFRHSVRIGTSPAHRQHLVILLIVHIGSSVAVCRDAPANNT